MSKPHDFGLFARLLWLWPLALIAGLCIAGLGLYRAIEDLQSLSIGIKETPPSFRSTGPTVVQLERLQYLVSTRVNVADVLVGESRWLEGSWIIQGDALIGVDMSKAQVREKDPKGQTAVIILPRPTVLSPRVNHGRTKQWDIKSRSWIPLASLLLGDRTTMEKQAMLEAQQLIERAAASEEINETARRFVQGTLAELYRGLGWNVSVQWQ
ncbi:MAG TPA: DUF4230 domain-containing protein [Isosphaeraceae bacterium]|nr:DUF4230 domain-containing protein [Isosphaeraceae bacterium]